MPSAQGGTKRGVMPSVFLSDERPLHRVISAVFAPDLQTVFEANALRDWLADHDEALAILDAEYAHDSGYALCENLKLQYGEKLRVHIISNELGLGEEEKARFSRVDRLFLVPFALEELVQP